MFTIYYIDDLLAFLTHVMAMEYLKETLSKDVTFKYIGRAKKF